MSKIAIDLPIVLDPYWPALIVLMKRYWFPIFFSILKVWGPPGGGLVLTSHDASMLRIFEEEFDERLDRFFGFDTRRITQDNFCAGIRLLRYAQDHGMILFLPKSKFGS
jgi:hypothetical protein